MRVSLGWTKFRNVADYVWLYGLFLILPVAYLISVSPPLVAWGVIIIVVLFMILTGGSIVHRWLVNYLFLWIHLWVFEPSLSNLFFD